MGPVPVPFWAAAHTCDITRLDTLISMAELGVQGTKIIARDVKRMIASCEINVLRSVGLKLM